ncbi:MAG: hypothetical protein KBF88_09935 [Polyangiaceae bacterium]|nr:hypothetical protein [Polyangiaceae bacterium]
MEEYLLSFSLCQYQPVVELRVSLDDALRLSTFLHEELYFSVSGVSQARSSSLSPSGPLRTFFVEPRILERDWDAICAVPIVTKGLIRPWNCDGPRASKDGFMDLDETQESENTVLYIAVAANKVYGTTRD